MRFCIEALCSVCSNNLPGLMIFSSLLDPNPTLIEKLQLLRDVRKPSMKQDLFIGDVVSVYEAP